MRPALVPLIDLANHDGSEAGPSARISLEEAKSGPFGKGKGPACVSLVANRDMGEGAAVCVRYGGEAASAQHASAQRWARGSGPPQGGR